MGMDLYLSSQMISEKTHNRLKNKELYINPYNLELIDADEINHYYKRIFFDIIAAMAMEDEGQLRITIDKDFVHGNLFDYFKANYKDIIEELDLDIYINEDYTDCLTLDEWLDASTNDYEYYEERRVEEETIDGIKVYLLLSGKFC